MPAKPSPLRYLQIFMAIITLSFAYCTHADQVRDTLFRDTDKVLNEATNASADMLAPSSFAKGMKFYQRAEHRLAKGKSIDDIKEELMDASRYFKQAIENSVIAKVTFESVLKARQDAISADSPNQSTELWNKAQDEFWSAAKALEKGNLKRAQANIPDTIKAYRAAELASIKSSYLSETRILVQKAEKQKVMRYAPKTLTKAQSLLAQAEKELTENRYDTDYPRALAKQAKYEVKHALYIAKLVEDIEDELIAPEDFILQSEMPLTEIASTLDIAAQFDQGFDGPTALVKGKLLELLKESYELSEKRTAMQQLESNISELELRLGIQSERLAEQETQRQKIKEVTDLFSEDEAVVLTQGKNVLIRLIGLTFDPGSSTVATRNFNLLNRVQKSLHIFNKYHVVVEGHTDSFGSDETNLDLSIDRASAVKEYLLANMSDLSSDSIEAFGYGETRPIANNETPEGRTRNRRIDLLLIPTL